MNKLKHIAVIADGNGRWAQKRELPREFGHEEGLKKIEDLMKWCNEKEISILSVYVFSLENWKRPKEETDKLAELAEQYFDRYQEFAEHNIRVLVSGVSDKLPQSAIEKIERLQRETSHCNGHILNLCANYSGRREIIDAIAKGARTEEEISAAMYHNLPEPDLIIRTGGHQRLSNFMMWQSAYSELYFTDTLFPDLTKGEFNYAIQKFNTVKRKFGGLV